MAHFAGGGEKVPDLKLGEGLRACKVSLNNGKAGGRGGITKAEFDGPVEKSPVDVATFQQIELPRTGRGAFLN